jgi:hypothetical protein
MVWADSRMFLRRSQFSLRSMALLTMRSTLRSKMISSSSCIWRVSVRPRWALGEKSSRRTEPNRANSSICQRWQKAAIFYIGSSVASIFIPDLPSRLSNYKYLNSKSAQERRIAVAFDACTTIPSRWIVVVRTMSDS